MSIWQYLFLIGNMLVNAICGVVTEINIQPYFVDNTPFFGDIAGDPGLHNLFVGRCILNRCFFAIICVFALSTDAFPSTNRFVRMLVNGALVVWPSYELFTLRTSKAPYLHLAPTLSYFLFETTTAQLMAITATNICLFGVKYCVRALVCPKRLQLLSAPYEVHVSASPLAFAGGDVGTPEHSAEMAML